MCVSEWNENSPKIAQIEDTYRECEWSSFSFYSLILRYCIFFCAEKLEKKKHLVIHSIVANVANQIRNKLVSAGAHTRYVVFVSFETHENHTRFRIKQKNWMPSASSSSWLQRNFKVKKQNTYLNSLASFASTSGIEQTDSPMLRE